MNKTHRNILFLLGLIILLIFPGETHALLSEKCVTMYYDFFVSDIIIHGKVIKQEAREETTSMGTLINTYSDIQVDKYLKGKDSEIITVKTGGGNIGDKWQMIEDTPSFQIGETGYLSLRKGEFYYPICGRGMQKYPPFFKEIIILIALLLFIALIVILVYKKSKKNK